MARYTWVDMMAFRLAGRRVEFVQRVHEIVPRNAKVGRGRDAFKLYAAGHTFRVIGVRLGRLDGRGPASGTTARSWLKRWLRAHRLRPPIGGDRDFCRLLLAVERADKRFEGRYRELLSEMDAVLDRKLEP